MRKTKCESCASEFPLNETFRVLTQTLCAGCAEMRANDKEAAPLQEGDVARNIDPSVCTWCGGDHEQAEHALLIAGQPTCEPCNVRMRNRPYPLWIKASFAVLLAVGVGAFAYNYRFIDALVTIRQAREAMDAGNAAHAADLWAHAARRVPEEPSFADQAGLMRGVAHLVDDHPGEAVPLIESYVAKHPKELPAQQLLLNAKISKAFDDQDYQEMWNLATQLMQTDDREARFRMSGASAAACLYASQGEEEYRQQADKWLDEARERGATGSEADKFEDRIRHRLATREIIRSKEFEQRFPNGWHGGKAPE